MSVVFMDGFDYGLPAAPKWDSVSLSNTYTAGGGRRTGTGALDLESTGDNVVKTLPAATTELIVGMAIKGWQEGVFLELYEGATKQVTIGFGASPNFYLTVKNGDGTTLHTDGTANTETGWVYFEIRVKCDDAAGEVQIYKDGTDVVDETGLDTNNGGSSTIDKFKLLGTHAGSTWFDDLYVVDVADAVAPIIVLGPTARVDTLFPRLEKSTAWSPSTGTDNAALLDETPYDTADYVSSSSVNATDLHYVDSLGYNPTAIYGAQVNVVALEDVSGGNEVAPVVQPTSTTYAGTSVALGTSAQLFASLWTTNPQTSAAWTKSDLANMAAGVKLTAV